MTNLEKAVKFLRENYPRESSGNTDLEMQEVAKSYLKFFEFHSKDLLKRWGDMENTIESQVNSETGPDEIQLLAAISGTFTCCSDHLKDLVK